MGIGIHVTTKTSNLGFIYWGWLLHGTIHNCPRFFYLSAPFYKAPTTGLPNPPAPMELEKVQDIASAVLSSGTLPAQFIRQETEQPGITTVKGQTLAVPVVDFSNPDQQSVIQAIDDASRHWGMFQIINHNIPNEAIAHLQAVGKEFFELPTEEKEVYAKPPGSKSVEGYGTKLQKEVGGKKDWVDHLFHIIWPPSAVNFKFWPQKPPSYRYSIS